MVPALRPLGVTFISCGEAHTAVLTKVRPSALLSVKLTIASFREFLGVFRMARFSPLERAATDSWDTIAQPMN